MKLFLVFLLSTMVACAQVTIHPGDIKPVPTGTVLGGDGTGKAAALANPSVTSLNKITFVPPATGATVTFGDGKTITFSNSLILTANDGSTLNIGNGGTLGGSAYEPAIGNPSVNGYILSSTTSGVRSWVPNGAGGGVVTSLAGTANEVAVSAATGAVTISLPSSLTFTGKTITGGTYTGVSGLALGTGGGGYSIDVAKSGPSLRLLDTAGGGKAFVFESVAGQPAMGSDGTILVSVLGSPIGTFDASGWNGNSATTTRLQTARTINGVSFDGSANITIPVGSGDVVGPASATDGNIALFNTGTGKLIKDSGVAPATFVFRNRVAVNVKDYGAVGDGSTNDTAAIAAAIAALPSTNAALYFPGGTYLTDTVSITSKVGLTVFGDGYGSSRIKHRSGAGQVINCDSTNSYVVIRDLAFDGHGTTRAAGQHAVVMDCSYSRVINCEVVNSGEFCIAVASNTAVVDFMVLGCLLHSGYADGINFQGVTRGIIANNIVETVDDDCIAVGYNGSGNKADGIVVIGNRVSARNDLGTSTGRGILVLRANDVLIVGNHISDIKQHGIYILTDDTSSSTNCPAKTVVKDNFITRTCISSGHGIEVAGVIDCSLINNTITEIASGNCIELSDYHEVTIIGGVLESRQAHYCRGIHMKDSAGTYAWGNSWVNLIIKDVQINMTNASNNESVYLAPDASVTLDYLTISNVTSYQTPAGDYVYTNHLGSAAKIVNNTSITGNSISNGGAGLAPTLANNN